MSREQLIRRTLDLAREAVERGDHPFGALVVVDNEVRFEVLNSVVSDRDATRHAELKAVSLACQNLSEAELARAVLVTSTEPCAMCCGAVYWAGIRTVVFGCPENRLGEYAGEDFLVPASTILNFGKEKVELIGPVLEEESALLHKNFWGKPKA